MKKKIKRTIKKIVKLTIIVKVKRTIKTIIIIIQKEDIIEIVKNQEIVKVEVEVMTEETEEKEEIPEIEEDQEADQREDLIEKKEMMVIVVQDV